MKYFLIFLGLTLTVYVKAQDIKITDNEDDDGGTDNSGR